MPTVMTNTKIKIFGATTSKELENVVNAFIEGKTVTDIKFQTTFVGTKFHEYTGAILEGTFVDRAMIIYEEEA